MAKLLLRADSAHCNAAPALPVGLLSRAVLQLPRTEMERLAQSLIDRMDLIDGDSDFEPDHEFYDACDLYEGGDHTNELLEYGSDQSTGPRLRVPVRPCSVEGARL